MKIDKTEREFRKPLMEAIPPQVGIPKQRERIVDALIAALDLEFKEEKPELPERIGAAIDHFAADLGESEEQSSMLTFQETPDTITQGCTFAVYREAAARYNAVGDILAHGAGHIHVDHVRRVLRRERERLQ